MLGPGPIHYLLYDLPRLISSEDRIEWSLCSVVVGYTVLPGVATVPHNWWDECIPSFPLLGGRSEPGVVDGILLSANGTKP